MRQLVFPSINPLFYSTMERSGQDFNTARFRRIIAVVYYYFAMTTFTAILYASPGYWAQPYHTSKLTGQQWVQELMLGHPDRIYTELGMRLHVFTAFVWELRMCGLSDSRYITLEEKAAIFLYSSVTGLSIRHVGERFQHSNETISRYVLCRWMNSPILSQYLQILSANTLCSFFQSILLPICCSASRG